MQILSQDSADWPKDERGQRLEPVAAGSKAHLQGDLLILAVGNGRQAGGGMELCPDAGDQSWLVDVAVGDVVLLGGVAREHKHELIRQRDKRWQLRGRGLKSVRRGAGQCLSEGGGGLRSWPEPRIVVLMLRSWA